MTWLRRELCGFTRWRPGALLAGSRASHVSSSLAAVQCEVCGGTNRVGRKFCSRCGASLAKSCPSRGAANEPEDRFCGECGAPFAVDSTAADERIVGPQTAPDRRLVSVMFTDLVGFISFSEARDAPAVHTRESS